MAEKLIGTDIAPPDLVAKVTGRAKYSEDFRAEGMVFAKLLLSPMPHARVRRIDASRALAMHFGTFDLSDEALDEPPRRFRAAASTRSLGADVAWILKIGETRPF